MENEAMDLQGSVKGYMGELEWRTGREKCCDYIIISIFKFLMT